MKKKPEEVKREAYTERKGYRSLTDEEVAEVTAANSEKCDGCEYNSNGACRSYRTMGTECPHGFA